MTPDDLAVRRASGEGLVVVDVRSRREYAGGHVPGAVHLPFWRALVVPLPKASGLVLYCGHGPRARIAQALLALRGVRHMCLLDGHYARWRRESRAVER